MTTNLQLCQDTARDSGTFPNLMTPQTTTGQSGRVQRLIYWVRDAYNDIQRHRPDWRWLRTDFSGTTISGVQTYDSTAMGIASRFSNWIHQGARGRESFTIYLTSSGISTEGFLEFIEWEDFRNMVLVGSSSTETGYPNYISINDQNELVLYPIPDDAYTVRGRYYKDLQTLSADADVPEMPARFHEMIKWRALILLGTFDEATEQQPHWQINYQNAMSELVRHQTPGILAAEPLA